MKALRIGQQRNEQLRKSAWQTSTYGQKFMEREKQLFGYYGMGTLEKMDGYLVEIFSHPIEQGSILIPWSGHFSCPRVFIYQILGNFSVGQLDIFTKRLYNKNNAVQVPNSIFTTLFVQVSMVTSLILKVELLNSPKLKNTYDLLENWYVFPLRQDPWWDRCILPTWMVDLYGKHHKYTSILWENKNTWGKAFEIWFKS